MYTKPSRLAARLLTLALAAALAWLGLRYLLPWLAPFLLALALAAVLEPAVRRLTGRGWRRGLAAGVCTAGLLTGAGVLLWLLAEQGAGAAAGLAARLPELMARVTDGLGRLEAWAWNFVSGNDGLGAWLSAALEALTGELEALPVWFSGKLLALASGFAGSVPDVFFFAFTAAVGTYLASASYPALCRFFLAQLPEAWQEKSRRLWHSLRNSVGRYFRVQLILMGVVFALLTAAFCILGVRYALVIAAVTAAIDALPVFGSGLVLLPWAAFSLLTGDFPLGIGLALAYGAVTVVRNCLQVKLLGTQLGLHPLASLLAVYVGWRAMGVWGMVVLPIAAVTVQQLNDEGVIHLWKSMRVPEATK